MPVGASLRMPTGTPHRVLNLSSPVAPVRDVLACHFLESGVRSELTSGSPVKKCQVPLCRSACDVGSHTEPSFGEPARLTEIFV